MSGQNAHLAMLSPREIEVLRLIVRGSTNAEIAAQLCLSERTIHRHVSNILTKLDVRRGDRGDGLPDLGRDVRGSAWADLS